MVIGIWISRDMSILSLGTCTLKIWEPKVWETFLYTPYSHAICAFIYLQLLCIIQNISMHEYIYLSLLVPVGHRSGHVQRRHHAFSASTHVYAIYACMNAIHYYIRQSGMCLSFVVREHANSFGFGRLVQYTSSQPQPVYIWTNSHLHIAAETTTPDPFHH